MARPYLAQKLRDGYAARKTLEIISTDLQLWIMWDFGLFPRTRVHETWIAYNGSAEATIHQEFETRIEIQVTPAA
jgi:hypothetical protein